MKKIVTLLLALTLPVPALADNGEWFRSLHRQDGRNCCAEYDAVWAEWVGTENGMYVVEITGGGPRDHEWAPIGRRYLVGQEFIVWNRGNPLGRPIMFLSPSTLEPLCFVPAGSGA